MPHADRRSPEAPVRLALDAVAGAFLLQLHRPPLNVIDAGFVDSLENCVGRLEAALSPDPGSGGSAAAGAAPSPAETPAGAAPPPLTVAGSLGGSDGPAGAASGRRRLLVVLSTVPGVFSAGADLRRLPASEWWLDGVLPPGGTAELEESVYRFSRRLQHVYDRLASLPAFKLALLDGHALGGGCELMLACDAAWAIDRAGARFGLPETRLGLWPGGGGSLRLGQRIGGAEAEEAIRTGRTFTASEALDAGLIDRLLPAGSRPLTGDPAEELAVYSSAYRARPLGDAADAEARTFARLAAGTAARDAVRAFLNR